MKFIETLALSILAVFAPIQATIAVVALLILADLITGIIASKKRGEPITSAGIKRTVGKVFLYEIALCLSFLVQQYLTGDYLPACKLVGALIGLTELKSILENLETISGDRLFRVVLSKITQSQKEIESNEKK